MFIDVESFFFNTLVNTQTCNLLDCSEEDDTTASSPEVNNDDAECLSTEESKSVSVETTVAQREYSCKESTDDTADTELAPTGSSMCSF